MERYVYIRSDECKYMFNVISPYKFKVQLKLPFRVIGNWKVAVCDLSFTYSSNMKNVDYVFIYSDICGESIVFWRRTFRFTKNR